MTIVRIPTASQSKVAPDETDFVIVGVPVVTGVLDFKEIAEVIFSLTVEHVCTGTLMELIRYLKKYEDSNADDRYNMMQQAKQTVQKYKV
jgi:hypothetical protein